MIVIHAAGNEQIGIGHLSRCRTLSFELARHAGMAPILIYEADEELARRFQAPGTTLYAVGGRREAMMVRRRVLKPRDSGWGAALITDLLGLVLEDSEEARKQGFACLVHLNDSAIGKYAADLFVDADAFKHDEACMVGPSRVLRGPRYQMVNPDVVRLRPPSAWMRPSVDRVLVSLGGADPGRQTEALLDGLPAVRGQPSLTLVAGPAFGAARQAQLRRRESAWVHVVEAPGDMGGLILDHDVIVTLGGLTGYEAMCLGRPVAAVRWSNMSDYVSGLAGAGLVLDLGEAPAAAGTLLDACRSPERLASLASRGWGAIDGKGAARVVEAIRRLLDGS